jgi:hypothetical protein
VQDRETPQWREETPKTPVETAQAAPAAPAATV